MRVCACVRVIPCVTFELFLTNRGTGSFSVRPVFYGVTQSDSQLLRVVNYNFATYAGFLLNFMRTCKFEATPNFVNKVVNVTELPTHERIIEDCHYCHMFSGLEFVIKILTSYATFFLKCYNLRSTKRTCDLKEAIRIYVWWRTVRTMI